MTPTLLLDAGLAYLLALLYAYVARVIARRSATSVDARDALRAFTVWWTSLAAVTALGATRSLLAGFDVLDRGVHAGLAYLSVIPLVAAIWGLFYYLVYIYLGHARWRNATIYAHVAFGVVLFLTVVWMHPVRVQADEWSTTLEYEHELSPGVTGLILLGILGPVLAAALAYMTLLFRTRDAQVRYRISMVSGAFLLWFGTAALATPLGWNTWDLWPLASRGIGLLSTLLILLAYSPPRVVRELIGGEPFDASTERDRGARRPVPGER